MTLPTRKTDIWAQCYHIVTIKSIGLRTQQKVKWVWRGSSDSVPRSDIWPKSWRVKWSFPKVKEETSMKNKIENCPLQDLRGLLPSRKNAVKTGNQQTEARWLWEVRNHRAAYSVCARKQKGRRKQLVGEWGEGRNERGALRHFAAWWLGSTPAPPSKRKGCYCALRTRTSVIKRYKVTEGGDHCTSGRAGTLGGRWGAVMGQRTWSSLGLVSNVLFPDLSSSDKGVCCINNSLSCLLLLLLGIHA